jgi:hypothetical protein
MFVMVIGGSPKPGDQSDPSGSRGRGLVRYQNRSVGNAPFESDSQREAD